MFNFVSRALDKMGNWFGIIFKLILPAVVMYRPAKFFALSFLVYGTTLGGDFRSLNGFCEILFYAVCGVLLLMLLLFPKAASATEFGLMGLYFINLTVFSVTDYFTNLVSGLEGALSIYFKWLPVIILFFAGKIFFYIYLSKNRVEIARKQMQIFNYRSF